MNRIILVIVFISAFIFAKKIYAQAENDFSFWNWYQVEYNINKHQYVNVQFQYRLNENASQFDKSNLYFTYGRYLGKRWNAEVLYQFTTNHFQDAHTFYAGLTYRLKLGKCKLFYRTSAQHIRNYFTGDYAMDDPYTEWRNRLRFVVPISKSFDMSISAEPYLKFTPIRAPYFSRIRNVLQCSYAYNKYQTITAFFMYEPHIISYSVPHDDEVIGLTWQITLPKKLKHFEKIFKKAKDNKKQNKDLFQ